MEPQVAKDCAHVVTVLSKEIPAILAKALAEIKSPIIGVRNDTEFRSESQGTTKISVEFEVILKGNLHEDG